MLNSAEAVKLGFVKTDDFSHRDDSFVDDFDLHERKSYSDMCGSEEYSCFSG